MNPFSTKNRSTMMTALLTVLILIALWWFFFRSPATPASPLSVSGTAATPENSQLLSLVGELTNVSFDTSIFTDPRFNTLIDISTSITPEPSGKNDPFAPIGR